MNDITTAARRHRLPLLAVIGAALFTATWFVLGFVSPGYRLFDLVVEPYSVVSQPISGLGLGVTAPFMNTAFVVGGLLVVAGSLGIWRAWPAAASRRSGAAVGVLLACSGVGMIIDGIFTLEQVLMHLVGFVLAVIAPAIGFLIGGITLRRVWPKTAAWLLVAAVLTVGLFILFMVTFDPYSAGDNVGYAGLLQRTLTTITSGTIATLGLVAARSR